MLKASKDINILFNSEFDFADNKYFSRIVNLFNIIK